MRGLAGGVSRCCVYVFWVKKYGLKSFINVVFLRVGVAVTGPVPVVVGRAVAVFSAGAVSVGDALVLEGLGSRGVLRCALRASTLRSSKCVIIKTISFTLQVAIS